MTKKVFSDFSRLKEKISGSSISACTTAIIDDKIKNNINIVNVNSNQKSAPAIPEKNVNAQKSYKFSNGASDTTRISRENEREGRIRQNSLFLKKNNLIEESSVPITTPAMEAFNTSYSKIENAAYNAVKKAKMSLMSAQIELEALSSPLESSSSSSSSSSLQRKSTSSSSSTLLAQKSAAEEDLLSVPPHFDLFDD